MVYRVRYCYRDSSHALVHRHEDFFEIEKALELMTKIILDLEANDLHYEGLTKIIPSEVVSFDPEEQKLIDLATEANREAANRIEEIQNLRREIRQVSTNDNSEYILKVGRHMLTPEAIVELENNVVVQKNKTQELEDKIDANYQWLKDNGIILPTTMQY